MHLCVMNSMMLLDFSLVVCILRCKYFDDGSESWVSPSGVCRVTNSLGDDDDFVRCECLHMTHYGVTATTRDDDIIGYVVWFYVICFICMVSI